jgi:hypothetical protein
MWWAQLLNQIAAIHGTGVAASTNSYESIATVTVGSTSVADVTFSSIPSTYKHLQIRYLAKSARTDNTLDELNLRFNSDTGNNYAEHSVFGNGSGAFTGANTSQSNIELGQGWLGTSAGGSQFGVGVVDVLDYTNTSKNTTVRVLGGLDMNGSGRVGLGSGLWMNTNAVTSITLYAQNGNIVQYSQFALYGIKG